MMRSARIVTAALIALMAAGVSSTEVTGSPQSGRVVSRQKPSKDVQKQRTSRQKASRPAEAQKPEARGPMEVFSDIERGWRANNVDLILRHFGKSKVSIAIEAGPSGGKFSKSQSYYLLKDLFKYTITSKFEFVQYRKPSKNGKTSFAVAERQYKKTDDGRLFKDKIYVSLHTEDGEQWVVNEIKSIR